MKQEATATFGLESYEWDYYDLAQVIGEEKALEKVALYFKKPFSENPLISGSRLFRTFLEWAGDKAKDLVESTNVAFVPPTPPELNDEEYYDPTDKGLTWIIPNRTSKIGNSKRKIAGRARRNG